MKQINLYKILSLILIAMLSLGCEKQVDKAHVIVEQDGEVYSSSFEDIDASNIEYIKRGVNSRFNAYDYDLYSETENIVDKNIYNFLVILPIKSKSNLKEEFYNVSTDREVNFIISSDYKRFGTEGLIVGYHNVSKGLDDFYHYKLYIHSQVLAATYYLNDIKDTEIYVNYHQSNQSEEIKLTSNKLTIKAEEFEHMLDRLAISHERLSFQPDGY